VTDDSEIAKLASELHTPAIEIADSFSLSSPASKGHRIARGSSRERVSPEEVFELASQIVQESRSASLFERP